MPNVEASSRNPSPRALALPVDAEHVRRIIGPMSGLVEQLIGVEPNSDPYLAIWPPGLRSTNLLVPALFNLPTTLFNRGRLKVLVGLSAYGSSRAAGCVYCMTHTCSFAMKRGARADAVTGSKRDDVEAAAVAVGEALGSVPVALTAEHLTALEKQGLSRDDVRWVSYAAGVMGFLNKIMDVLRVELEPDSLNLAKEVLAPTGWTPGKHLSPEATIPDGQVRVIVDNIGTYARVISFAPRTVLLRRNWTRGVPNDNAAAKAFLEKEVGFSFRVLDSVGPGNVVRALTTVLRDNLDPGQTVVGLEAKCVAALIFARCVSNPRLEGDAKKLAHSLIPKLEDGAVDAVLDFATTGVIRDKSLWAGFHWQPTTEAVLALVREGSAIPVAVTDETVSAVAKILSPAQIVEVVVWLAVLQMLHRLDGFHAVRST